MAAIDNIITIPTDRLEEIYQGQSFIIKFDLSDIFGEIINPVDWEEIYIHLYHKYTKEIIYIYKDLGEEDKKWLKSDLTITFEGDLAIIRCPVSEESTINNSRTGIYRYSIELQDPGAFVEDEIAIFRKKTGDCFILKYAMDE